MHCRKLLGYLSLALVLSFLPASLCADAKAQDGELEITVAVETPEAVAKDPEMVKMEEEMAKLALEQQLREQAKATEMAEFTDQTSRIQAELALEQQRRQQVKAADLAAFADQTERIQAEIALEQAKQTQALLTLQLEREKMDAELALIQKKHALAIAELARDTELMQAKMANAQAAASMAMADVQAKMADLDTAATLRQKELAEELAAMTKEKAELEAQTALMGTKMAYQSAEQAEAMAAVKQEIAEMSLEKELLATKHSVAMQKLSLESEALAAKGQAMDAELALRAKVLTGQTKAAADVPHPADPIIDGALHISDRRIEMPEFVVEGTAKYISDRLNFYNNLSGDDPIFLVMERCYGGSVIEGFRIMQAIESSDAPVYVVVKSFAASMGAGILANAEHSVAYPNAQILHHEMSSEVYGSTTEMKEELAEDEAMEMRLLEPVAEKMGITPAEFRKQMYEHNSNGDWIEYGDDAVELKWVNTVVDEIREQGIIEEPQGRAPSRYSYLFDFRTDEDGTEYVQLPPLKPHDFYFAHEPTNYYRK